MEIEQSRGESGDVNSILISWELDLSRALVKEQSEKAVSVMISGLVRMNLNHLK